MTVRPIIFSGPMVRVLLMGRKTQTRRILKPQPKPFELEGGELSPVELVEIEGEDRPRVATGRVLTKHHAPYAPGDLLYVRESFHPSQINADHDPRFGYPAAGVAYMADWSAGQPAWKWRPSIHLPRSLSRLTLEVSAVKVERLQDINADDCRAEGHPPGPAHYPQEVHDDAARDWFMDLWDEINAKRGPWSSNPFVVAVTFAVHRQNVDALLSERKAA